MYDTEKSIMLKEIKQTVPANIVPHGSKIIGRVIPVEPREMIVQFSSTVFFVINNHLPQRNKINEKALRDVAAGESGCNKYLWL